MCQFFYECVNCKTVLRPKDGDCCVYCSHGTVRSPSNLTVRTRVVEVTQFELSAPDSTATTEAVEPKSQ